MPADHGLTQNCLKNMSKLCGRGPSRWVGTDVGEEVPNIFFFFWGGGGGGAGGSLDIEGFGL